MKILLAVAFALALPAAAAHAQSYTYTPTAQDMANIRACIAGFPGEATAAYLCVIRRATQLGSEMPDILKDYFDITSYTASSPQLRGMVVHGVKYCLPGRELPELQQCIGNEAQKMGRAIGEALAAAVSKAGL